VSDAETHVAFRHLGRGLAGGVVLTLAIHGVLAFLLYQSQRRSPARPEAVRDFIVTRTVVLGKKREKFWLPRIVEPPKPKAPEPVIKVAENPEAPAVPPPPKEAPKPQDKEISKDLRRALDRARRLAAAAEEEPEGSPLGSLQGTSTEATTGDEYWSQVHDAIHRNWSVSAGLLNDAQLAVLLAEVRVQIDADGSIRNPVLSKSSGNDLYDQSCMQAVRATGQVPAPPPDQRNRARRGVVLEFPGKDVAK
jgi:TonB family protein